MRAKRFKLLPDLETAKQLRYACRLSTACRNLAFQQLRAADADEPTMIQDHHPRREKDGKPDFKAIFGKCPVIRPGHAIRRQFPKLSASIVDTICYEASGKYRQIRIAILTGKQTTPESRGVTSLPVRDRLATIRREGEEYVLNVTLHSKHVPAPDRKVSMILATRHIPDAYRSALDRYASGADKLPRIVIDPSERRKGLWWFAYIPMDVEPQEHERVKGRQMIVYVPDRDERGDEEPVFLRCRVNHQGSAPWSEDVEHHSALRAWNVLAKVRKLIDNKYRCDRRSGCRWGHGRERVKRKSRELSAKFRRLQKTFNQRRAKYIISLALRWKCESIEMVDLTKYDPRTLVLGKWAYYEFKDRVADLAAEHGIEIKFVEPADPKDHLG